MDLKKLLSTMGILGLFTFSIMAFIITTQNDSEITNKITDNEFINQSYSDLGVELSSTSAETASNTFGEVTPTQEYGELEVTSIVSPTKVAKTMIFGFWNIFIKLPQDVLGVDESVATLISSILLIFIIIGIWAIWKGVVS